MIRLLTIFLLLHGTVFFGAGSALEHVFHQLEAQAQLASDSADHSHHHHHHEGHDETGDEPWINCVFCLDGVGGTGIEPPLLLSFDFHQTAPLLPTRVIAVSPRYASFVPRAPPIIS